SALTNCPSATRSWSLLQISLGNDEETPLATVEGGAPASGAAPTRQASAQQAVLASASSAEGPSRLAASTAGVPPPRGRERIFPPPTCEQQPPFGPRSANSTPPGE